MKNDLTGILREYHHLVPSPYSHYLIYLQPSKEKGSITCALQF